MFIGNLSVLAAFVLTHFPVKIPSGKYDETMKVERTQADLINEMAQELTNLPNHTAYVKLLQVAESGAQTVLKRRVQTEPLLRLPDGSQNTNPDYIEQSVLKTTREASCRPRADIEVELAKRQQPWRGTGRDVPPPRRVTSKAVV
jgi:hypothetical protein